MRCARLDHGLAQCRVDGGFGGGEFGRVHFEGVQADVIEARGDLAQRLVAACADFIDERGDRAAGLRGDGLHRAHERLRLHRGVELGLKPARGRQWQ